MSLVDNIRDNDQWDFDICFLVLFSENGKAEASQGRGWDRDCWSQNHYGAFFPEEARRGQITFYKFEFFFFFNIQQTLVIDEKTCLLGKKKQTSGDSGANVKRLEKETDEKIEQLKNEASRISRDVVDMLLKHVTTVNNWDIYTIRLWDGVECYFWVDLFIIRFFYGFHVSTVAFDFELQPWELLYSSLWRRTEYRSFVYCNKFQNKRKPMIFFFVLIMKVVSNNLLQWNSK